MKATTWETGRLVGPKTWVLLLVLAGCSAPADGNLAVPDDFPRQEAPHTARASGSQARPGFAGGWLNLTHSQPTEIPDGDHGGATIGPLPVGRNGSVIRDVVLELELSHSCTSDVSVWLAYDEDNDGVCEVETPIDLYLARPGGRELPPIWACPVRLDGTYFFQYEPQAENLQGWDTGSLDRFRGLDKGGSFYLRVIDSTDGDTGTVASCTIHVR